MTSSSSSMTSGSLDTPVVSVTRFESDEQALGWANDCEYGLSAAVFSRNINTALTVEAGLRASAGGWGRARAASRSSFRVFRTRPAGSPASPDPPRKPASRSPSPCSMTTKSR